MDIENTKDLRIWIDKGEVSDNEKADIEVIIKAFSDYMTAVDPEYQYNKTFLKDFIPSFIMSNKMLNTKKAFLDTLIDSLNDYKEKLKIEIDNAWKYDGTKDSVILANFFDKSKVNSGKLYYQINYIDEKSFVLAGSIKTEKLDKDIDKVIEEVVDLFLSRLNENDEN
ncbi:hypothetical protein SAMN02910417_02513 [Eubacterium oxidoreducens]|uniref:Uncharacterized protein n=2 Tax=Eubacterium oxidoreducens TaxID=1732 RepID=A0A1G6CM73_EUBOX|nr:hypothetical protein SAMN02910417_02513 [Eubacterium oxidoreducens]